MNVCLTARGTPHTPTILTPQVFHFTNVVPWCFFKGGNKRASHSGTGTVRGHLPRPREHFSLSVPFDAGDLCPSGPPRPLALPGGSGGLSLLNPDRPQNGAARGGGVARVGGGRPHSPAIHGPDSHGHLDRCHSSSRPGPRGLPPGLRPAAAGHSSDSARAPAHFPLTRPSAAADLELLGGHTCQATEHAQSGSGPRDPRTGLWQLPTA